MSANGELVWSSPLFYKILESYAISQLIAPKTYKPTPIAHILIRTFCKFAWIKSVLENLCYSTLPYYKQSSNDLFIDECCCKEKKEDSLSNTLRAQTGI